MSRSTSSARSHATNGTSTAAHTNGRTPPPAACDLAPDSPPAIAGPSPSPVSTAPGSEAPTDRSSDSASASRPDDTFITDLREGVDFALGLLRAGLSDARIIDALREQSGWGNARAQRCLEKAYQRLEDLHATRSNRQRLALAVEQRNAILERALANDDARIALSAMDSRDKLLAPASDDASTTPTTLIDLLRSVPDWRSVPDGQAVPDRP